MVSADNRSPRRPGLVAIVALVIAIMALSVAGWTLYRTEIASRPSYSDEQRAEAKRTICEAMDIVRKGVSLNTNLVAAGGPSDVTGAQAVAANARISLYAGGQYLLARLDPATPSGLADAVRKFADGLLDIAANATAGAPNDDPAQAARRKDADALNATITEMCK
jgi:hypothetical protein